MDRGAGENDALPLAIAQGFGPLAATSLSPGLNARHLLEMATSSHN